MAAEKCAFCGEEMPAGQAACPECGRQAGAAEAPALFFSERLGKRQRREALLLRLAEPARPRLVFLSAKPRISLGRGLDNDLVVKPLRGGEADKEAGARISRRHAALEFAGARALLSDSSSAGTWLDGKKAAGTVEIREEGTIALAQAWSPILRRVAAAADPAPFRALFGEAWGDDDLSAWVLERPDLAGAPVREEYLLGFRGALIGAGEDCAVRLAPGSGAAAAHALLLHRDGVFWLQALARTEVDSRMVMAGEIVPLVPHLKLALGSLAVACVFPRQELV